MTATLQIPEKPITLMQAAQLFADAVNPGDQDTFRSYLNGILYRAHRGEIQGRLPTTREPLPTDGILPSDYVEKLVFTASDIRALAKIYDLEIGLSTPATQDTPIPGGSASHDVPAQPAPKTSQPDKAAQETTAERRARWLVMFEAEEKLKPRGALQRLANREGVDRSNMSKAIAKAREERDTQRRAGTWAAQRVQNGKRAN